MSNYNYQLTDYSYSDMARARVYTPWEPPQAGDKREGKKIMVEKYPQPGHVPPTEEREMS
jgi:hypothetical protein